MVGAPDAARRQSRGSDAKHPFSRQPVRWGALVGICALVVAVGVASACAAAFATLAVLGRSTASGGDASGVSGGTLADGQEGVAASAGRSALAAVRGVGVWDSAADALARMGTGRQACAQGLELARRAARAPAPGDAHSPTLLCMVLTSWPKQEPNMRVVLESWLRTCDQAAFLISDNPTSDVRPPKEIVTGEPYDDRGATNVALYPMSRAPVIAINVTGAGRDCVGQREECWKEGFLWRKVWQLYLRVYDLYVAPALSEGGGGWESVPEWFIKADDDSYLFTSHIRKHLRDNKYDPDEPHFMGRALRHVRHKHLPGGMISGNGLIMSRGAFKKLVEEALAGIVERTETARKEAEAKGQAWYPEVLTSPCIDRLGPGEDIATSICFGMINVTAENAEDSDGHMKSLIMQYRDHLMTRHGRDERGHPREWMWEGINPAHELANCCAPLDEIFHLHSFKGAERLRRMYEYRMLEDRLWEVKAEALRPLEQACAALGVE